MCTGSISSISSSRLVMVLPFDNSQSYRVKWYFFVSLIYIILMIREVEMFFSNFPAKHLYFFSKKKKKKPQGSNDRF